MLSTFSLGFFKKQNADSGSEISQNLSWSVFQIMLELGCIVSSGYGPMATVCLG